MTRIIPVSFILLLSMISSSRGHKLTFQLRGNSGEEKVKIHLDGSEEEFDLTKEWKSFSYPCPSNGQFSVEFLQDGITKDVFIQGHQFQVTDLLPVLVQPNEPTNWQCGTSNENERCELLRDGMLAWDGKYTWTVKCKAGQPGCSCSDHKEPNHLGGQIGACLSTLAGKYWCYVNNGPNSRCSDRKPSSRGTPSGKLWWSYAACDTYTEFQPNTGK